MPNSTRKSSIGTVRRASQKGYIPYRGDNPEVGKKTGIAVRHVERKSDGFEPFEEVMRQADARTPPKPKNKRPKAQRLTVLDEDENGEMSMELDDNVNTPLAYFKNARQQPLSANRVGSSSRPVGRPSVIDYDQIPSPRPTSARFSMASNSAGPSHLSKSFAAAADDDDDDDDDDFAHQLDFESYDDGATGDGSPDHAALADSRNGRRLSFAAMDQDGDERQDEEQEVEHFPSDPDPPLRVNGKGKGRATDEDVEDESMEQAIEQGLDDVERMDEGEASEHDRQVSPDQRTQAAKGKAKRERQPIKKVAQAPRRSSTPPGVRRSKRYRFRPLEWWRQERVVYGRRESTSGPILVPHIKEVITIPKEEPVPLGTKNQRSRRSARARSKSKAEEQDEPVYNPEEGWDDDTPAHARVLDFLTGEEVERRIAYTEKMLQPRPAANADWMFEKVFGDGEFIAAGELIIPPNCRKPSKPSKDNTYVFFVIEGAINLRIHNSSLILATGAMFMIPRGNTYFIENICQRPVRLFFTQARKMNNVEDDVPPKFQDPPTAHSSKATAARSSSLGINNQTLHAAPRNALKRAVSMRV